MRRFEHGGNVYAHPGCLDFSANLNPLGMPQRARDVLCERVDAFAVYPDPACHELVQAIAAFEEVPRAWVVPCAGATDAFARLCAVRKPRVGLVCAPCYSGYEQALEQVGARVTHVCLAASDDFVAGPALADALIPDIDMVFLANPNNPTGRCLPRDVLVGCLERARAIGALVVLDECFVDLSRQPRANDLLAAWPNLVLVKACTKTFCLAGLRLGYALCADEGKVRALWRAGQPWAVSVPAQLAGVACLEDEDFVSRSQASIAQERTYLFSSLRALGLRVVPGEANYLLFEAPRALGDALLARGVLVRSCDNFCGLDERWHRIAVRTHDQNVRLVAALGEVVR